MFPYLWAYAALLALAGFVVDTPGNTIRGLYTIVTTEDALITDYVLVAGPGAALVNSAIVTAISIGLLYLARDTLNGMTLVEMGLMSGFSLFGKNFLNIWPILLGTWLYAKVRRERLAGNIGIGLMATALAPIVSYIALDNGWGGPIEGVLVGVAIGFIMPPLASYTYRVQNGMNLYNVGFACGLVAMICVPLMASLGADPTTHYRWARGYEVPFGLMLGSLCALLIVGGLFFANRPVWAAWAGYRRLLQTSGRAPSDYLRMFGPAPVLINTGVNGLIGMAYILLSGGDLNGPTVGGILTIMGFSAFGKHAFNILPVMAGVALLLLGADLPGPVMRFAGYISDTVSPLALIYCGFIVYEMGLKNLRFLPGLPLMLVMRLAVAPAICWGCCLLFGVEGLAQNVFLVESALPVVSQVTVMAGAYGADEEYAATGACLSILGCFVTLPILMLILG